MTDKQRITWVLTECLLLLSAHVSLGLVNGACKYRKWSRPGTLKLLVIAGIHANSNGRCGDISTTNFPLVVALDWMLDIINGKRSNVTPYLPNITLGYDLYDNCDDEDMTVDMLYPGFTVSNSDCSGQHDNSTKQTYADIFSLTSCESTQVISRLAGSLPVLRAREPAPELNSLLQPNLIQTVASFEDETETLVQFLEQMNWNFVFLVYTDDEYGITTRNVFSSKSRENEICIHLEQLLRIKSAETSSTIASAETIITEIYKQISRGYHKSIVVVYLGNAKGAMHLLKVQKTANRPVGSEITWLFSQGVGLDFSVTHHTGFLQKYGLSIIHKPFVHDDFNDYLFNVLVNKTKTSFAALKPEYLSAIGCDNSMSVQLCHSLRFSSFNFVSNFVDSLLLTVAMLRELYEQSCQSDGLCLTMLEKLTKDKWYSLPNEMNFKLKFTDDYLPEGYQSHDRTLHFTDSRHIELRQDTSLQIFRLPNSSDTIAEFDGSELKIVGDISTFPTSACNLPMDCPVCRQHHDLRYSYLHGDILLLGLFSIHMYGDTPFQCGQVRHDTNDVITVSAFMESIQTARDTSGIAFGGIAIDDCYSAFNTSSFLSDLFSKQTLLRDHKSGEIIDFDKVFVIIGALSSPVSLVVGDLATAVGIPMISYGASSPELDNDARYPLFLRTVPSDTRQAKGIVQLIQKLNVTYVGAMYIDDAYGKNGIKALSAEAKALDICIVEPIAISQDTDNATLENIIRTLYEQGTRVIVYFSIDSLALRILGILSTKFSDRKPLVFIASEAWGTNAHILEGLLGQKAKGSLVFNVETMWQDNMDFRNYLLNLNSSQFECNRWIPKYFEDVYHCDFITSFDKSHTSVCPPFLELDNGSVDSLYQDQRGVHVIHAVHTSTTGFNKVINEVCGQVTVCPKLRKNGRVLKDAIQGIKLGNNGVSPFDASGSGNIGFTIVNIQRNNENGDISYVKIGSFSKHDQLTLTSDPIFYNDLHQPTTLSEMFPDNMQCSLFRHRCPDVCQITTESTQPPTIMPTETSLPEKGNDSTTLVTTVVLAVLLAVIVVALILVIVMLLRRQNQHISDETFSKSQSLSSHAFPSSNNLYNEVNDYQGSHPRSHFSSGFGTVSTVSEGPVQYADITQSQAAKYPEPRSELLSMVSTKSLSPGMSRPSNPLVEHTRSNSDSRILENSTRMVLSPHQLTGFLSPSTRSKGLENLNEINYSSRILDSNLVTSNKDRNVPSSASSYEDSEPEENYISPDSGSGSHSDFKANPEALTYITAKDLINHSDEEEDADDVSEASVKYTDMRSIGQTYPSTVDQTGEAFNPSLISPSDHEVKAINFPAKDKVSYSNNSPVPYSKNSPNNSHIRNIHEFPVKEKFVNTVKENNDVRNEPVRIRTDRRSQGNQRNYGKSSMSSVPDIIPYDADELRGTTSDSDEQEVFII